MPEQRIPLDGDRELEPGLMLERAEALLEESRRRRTVRDFSSRPIPDGLIEQCLRIACTAPSGANVQPWHFAVVRDADRKRAIRVAAEEEERAFYAGRASADWLRALEPLGTDPDKPFLETAPALIAIFGESSRADSESDKRTPNYYVKESVGIATGLLIHALHHCGLVSLTHTPSPMGFLNAICERPNWEKPYLLLVTGYPAMDATVPAAALERKPLAEVASYL